MIEMGMTVEQISDVRQFEAERADVALDEGRRFRQGRIEQNVSAGVAMSQAPSPCVPT